MARPVSGPKGRSAPAAVGNDWVEEGLWQLRLGGLWYVAWRSLHAAPPTADEADGEAPADTPAPAEADGPGSPLRQEMLERFLKPAWWPIARYRQSKQIPPLRFLHELFTSTQHPINLAEAEAIFDHFRARLAAFWEQHRDEWQKALGPKSVDVAFGDNLWEIAAAAKARANENKPIIAVETDWAGPVVPRVPVPQAVAHWIAQAGALAAWRRLVRAESGSAETPSADGVGPSALVSDCRQLREDLIQRNKDAGGRFTRWWPHNRSDTDLFKQVLDLLGRCEKAFERVAPVAAPRPANGLFAELIERVERHLQAAPSWPPNWLARLQESLGIVQLTPPADDDPHVAWLQEQGMSPGAAARLLLLRQLVAALDVDGRADQLSTADANVLMAGTGLTVELLHDEDPKRPRLVEFHEIEGLREPRIVGTGLIATGLGRLMMLRPVRIERPRPRPPWRSAVDSLAVWLNRHNADDHLAGLTREVQLQLRRLDPQRWWADHPADEERALLWRFLQRAATLPLVVPTEQTGEAWALVRQVLAEFEKAQFQFGTPPAGGEARSAVWTVAPLNSPGAQPLVVGPGLSTPDGWIAPSVWLLMPQAQLSERPLLQALAGAAASVAVRALAEADGAWEGWNRFNMLLTDLKTAHGQGAETIGRELFQLAYDRWRDARTPLPAREPCRKLAAAIYEGLAREPNAGMVLSLHPQTLAPERLTAPPASVPIELVEDGRETGTVLNFAGFGARAVPAVWKVSVGPPPEFLAPWWRLPAPRFAVAAPVQKWYEEVQKFKWQPPTDPKVVAPFRTELERWLETAAGGDWFHRFAQQAQSEAKSKGAGRSARDWLAALEQAGWCRCWPNLDLSSGEAEWPNDNFTQLANLKAEFLEQPRRRVSGPVRRFAPRPELADCTVSLGPRKPDSPSALADRVAQAAGDLAKRPELAGPLHALREAAHAAEVHHRPVSEPEKLAAGVLEGLAHEWLRPDAPTGTADQLDAALAALRNWCDKYGLAVLPRGWRFAAGPVQPPEGETGDADFVFAEAPAGAAVGLYQFGLEKAGQTLRPARLAISAGRGPAGYQAVLDLVVGPTSAEQALRDRLAGWPRMQGQSLSLEFEAIGLFQELWDSHIAQIQATDAARAAQLSHALEELLHTEYALRRFEPSGWQDPDYRPPEHWMERRSPGGTSRSGRLLRVLRPGLLKDDGQSAPTRALKAIIEVE